MNVYIIGTRSFESKKGKLMHQFYFTTDMKNVTGKYADWFWATDEMLKKYKIGDTISDVSFNFVNHSLYRSV